MTFQVNGSNGKYDNKNIDESTKYGQNAVDNHAKYMQAPLKADNNSIPPVFDFSPKPEAQDKNLAAMEKYVDDNQKYLDALPPLEYEYRYMPNIVNNKINKKAVLGAAYEEMGRVKEIPVKEFEEKFLLDPSMTIEPLDINKDGKIDNSEYAANILAADVLSKGTTDVTKVDGTVNSKGFNAILEYTKKSNAAAASKLYTEIYNTYGLGNP